MAEMLLQSHNEVIYLLPALPDAWDSGKVSGLKARGNLIIGMKWNNKKLDYAELKSNTTGVFTLYFNGVSKKLKLVTGKKYVVDGNLKIIKKIK